MLRWIKIAFRNVLRNRRRSFVTLFAIAIGFSSISLFNGYTDNTYEGLRKLAIQGEGLGHLTIFKKGWAEFGMLSPAEYLLTKDEVQQINRLVSELESVEIVTPQLHGSGLVGNGIQSTIFIATGVVPDEDKILRADFAERRPLVGETLQTDKPYAVEMAQDLARILNLAPQAEGTLMASTFDGQMNALGIEIAGVYNTGTAATNDKYMRIPFAYAQELYATDKADRVIVLLNDWQQTLPMQVQLEALLSQNGLDIEIKTWNEQSQFYISVKGMFDMIFTFIFAIVLIIVLMSVANTMGMAVIERTREIGTLRSLGMKQRGVSLLFALEGAMMGTLGCVVGGIITVAVCVVIAQIGPTYTPPSASSPVPLIVNLVPLAMARLTLFMLTLSLLAAILPARRAAKGNVVESLGHV
jgi:putative ABC transport system permease protein